MTNLSRRGVFGLGVASVVSSMITSVQAADYPRGDEHAVGFKIKNVTLERINEAERTVAVSFGIPDRPTRLLDLPLVEKFQLRVTHIYPGSVNNEPFEWDDLKRLLGKRVSAMFVAEANRLSIQSVAVAND
jgi:hypothetical protein